MQTKIINFFSGLIRNGQAKIIEIINKLPWFRVGGYKISILLPVSILVFLAVAVVIIWAYAKKRKVRDEQKSFETVVEGTEKAEPAVERSEAEEKDELVKAVEVTEAETEVKQTDEDGFVEETIDIGAGEVVKKEEGVVPATSRDEFIEKVRQDLEAKFINLVKRNFPEKIDTKIRPKIDEEIITLCSDNLDKLKHLEQGDDSFKFSKEYYKAKSIYYYYTGDEVNLKKSVEIGLSRFDDDSDFYVYKTILLINDKQYDDAKEMLLKAKEISPSDMNIYILLGELYFVQKDYVKSLEMFKQAILLDEKNSVSYAYKGYILAKKGFVTEGERNLKKSIKLDYRNYISYYFLGEIYLDINYAGKAVAMFKKAKEFGCTFDDLDEKLCFAFFKLKQYDAVIRILGKRVGKLSGVGAYILAESYYKEKNIEDALDLYKKLINKEYNTGNEFLDEKLIDIEKKESEVYLRLGDIYYKNLKDFDEALKYYQVLIEKEPNNLNADLRIAELYFSKEDYESGVKYYEKVVDKKEVANQPEVKYKLGYSYYKIKRYAEAVKHLFEAQKLGVIEEKLFIGLGYSLAQIKRTEEAIDAYNKALSINPYNFQTHNNVGVLYAQLGDYDKAIKEFKEALKLEPGNKDSLYNLHRAYKILAEMESEEYLGQLEKVV